MKWLDQVKVTSDKYEESGIKKGAVGTIILSPIRDNLFEVAFPHDYDWDDDVQLVSVADLELYKDNGLSDEAILEDLPKHNPNWWCKVEDGYILNLLGEKKNKIPYDYYS